MSDSKSVALPWAIAVLSILFALYALFFAPNRNANQYVPPAKVEIPPKLKDIAKFAIVFEKNQDNKFFVVDPEGNTLEGCKSCSIEQEKEYGPGCKNAPKDMNICGPLKPVIPLGTNTSLTFMQFRGSECLAILPAGDRWILIPKGCVVTQ